MQLPTHTDIEVRAYHIWEQEGRPQGRQLDHWLRAEREMSEVRTRRTPRSTARKAANAAQPPASAAAIGTTKARRPSA